MDRSMFETILYQNETNPAKVTPAQQEELDKLTSEIEGLFSTGVDDTSLEYEEGMDFYYYACFAHYGFVHASEDRITQCFVLFFNRCANAETIYDPCFIERFDSIIKTNQVGFSSLYWTWEDNYSKEVNPDICFLCAKAAADTNLSGMIGGGDLVEYLGDRDLIQAYYAEELLKEGSEHFDPITAAENLFSIHTDYLDIVHNEDPLENTGAFEKLFEALEAHTELENIDGYHYYLGRMFFEGIGTDIDYEKARQHLELAVSVKDTLFSRPSGWMLDRCSDERLVHLDLEKEDPKVGQAITLGKYNNRAIKWDVMNETKDSFVLLSRLILESTYITNRIYEKYIGKYVGRKDQVIPAEWYCDEYVTQVIDQAHPGYLFPQDRATLENIGKRPHLPRWEDLTKVPDLIRSEARPQAYVNGYDSEGLIVDEDEGTYAPYYVHDRRFPPRSEQVVIDVDDNGEPVFAQTGNTEITSIDEYGRLVYASVNSWQHGVRPVIYLKKLKYRNQTDTDCD